MKTRKKKASGANIPEAQRHTTAVRLRLPPAVAIRLRALAVDRGTTVSALVAAWVDAAGPQ